MHPVPCSKAGKGRVLGASYQLLMKGGVGGEG